MFISSMARKNKRERSKSTGYLAERRKVSSSSRVNLDLLENVPDIDISAISKSSGVMISGSSQTLREKGSHYKTNSEKTIRQLPRRSYCQENDCVLSIRSNPVVEEDQQFSYEDEILDDKDIRLVDSEIQAMSVSNIDRRLYRNTNNWYLNPIHRRTRLNIDINETFEENMPDFTEEHCSRQNVATKCTPYEMDLYRLRYEKLKLEEAYLLKLKCDQELERTRSPSKKWYELKTKEFTTEMEKHSNLLKHENNLQDFVNYRNDLLELSGEWSNLRH